MRNFWKRLENASVEADHFEMKTLLSNVDMVSNLREEVLNVFTYLSLVELIPYLGG